MKAKTLCALITLSASIACGISVACTQSFAYAYRQRGDSETQRLEKKRLEPYARINTYSWVGTTAFAIATVAPFSFSPGYRQREQ